jgi:hypothetical protein
VTSPRLRHNVVELLVSHHATLSDFSVRPWRLFHENGKPFTPAESALANSATPDEVVAAQKLALAGQAREQRKYEDLRRVTELLAMVPGWEDMQIPDVVARLPAAEQAEAIELLSRYSPAGLQS